MSHVIVTSLGKYSAQVFVDGVLAGQANDCDLGRWVMTSESDEFCKFDGCYPARNVRSFAYGIRECVDGVESVTVDGVDIDDLPDEPRTSEEWY